MKDRILAVTIMMSILLAAIGCDGEGTGLPGMPPSESTIVVATYYNPLIKTTHLSATEVAFTPMVQMIMDVNDGPAVVRSMDLRVHDVQWYGPASFYIFVDGFVAGYVDGIEATQSAAFTVPMGNLTLPQGSYLVSVFIAGNFGTGDYIQMCIEDVTAHDSNGIPVPVSDMYGYDGMSVYGHWFTVVNPYDTDYALASGSPSGASIPGYGEVLRFTMTNQSNEAITVPQLLMYLEATDLAAQGWTQDVPVDVFLSTNMGTTVGTGVMNAYEVSLVGVNIVIPPYGTVTVVVKMDTTGASTSQDDAMRLTLYGVNSYGVSGASYSNHLGIARGGIIQY